VLFLFTTVAGCSNINVNVQQDDHAMSGDMDKASSARNSSAMASQSSGQDPKPSLLNFPEVEYPPEVSGLEISGIVIIEAYLDSQGRVLEASVQQGLHPDIDQAVLESVVAFQFQMEQSTVYFEGAWYSLPFRWPVEE